MTQKEKGKKKEKVKWWIYGTSWILLQHPIWDCPLQARRTNCHNYHLLLLPLLFKGRPNC